jgi:aldehyde:ferredoxin oxidoreductase
LFREGDMNGWMGTILRVNLGNSEIAKEPLIEDIAHKYVGGRGLNMRILYDETRPGIDPLGPDNKLILGAGPCNGTLVPASSRLTITAKSPLTGFFGCSNGGGRFGAEIKYAGYDAVIIEGEAKVPVYLWIEDGKVELRDASELWGKTVLEARKILQAQVGYPDAAVLSIGPAGENLVKSGCIISDWGRAHGKTGMGAVMGSKKLKAIAVRGTKGVKVAHSDLLQEACKELRENWCGIERQAMMHANYGTTMYIFVEEAQGSIPVNNFRETGSWSHGVRSLYPESLKKYFLKNRACFSCFACGDHFYALTKGRFAGTWGVGLQNLTQLFFGPNIGVYDPDVVVRATALCNTYGLDVAMAGIIISWAMECFEKGILTEKDTGGLRLEWGNGDAALKLIEMIAYRQGIGDLFAEGVKAASEKIGKGAEKYAMHVKGDALDIQDPRPNKSWGLGCAVAGRGADHCMAGSASELGIGGWDPNRGECFDGEKVDPLAEKDKGKMVKWLEDVRGFQNCMQICLFSHKNPLVSKIGQPAMAAKFYNSVTGLGLTDRDVLRIGERVVNLEKAYNIREGWSRKDDTLPERFLKEPVPAGFAKGQVINLQPMIDEYYQERGWDKSGWPTKAKLVELGLEDVAGQLKS